MVVAAEETADGSGSDALLHIKELIDNLLSQLRTIQGAWERELHMRQHTVNHTGRTNGVRLCVYGPGCPFFGTSEGQLFALQSLGFSWSAIARILGMWCVCS